MISSTNDKFHEVLKKAETFTQMIYQRHTAKPKDPMKYKKVHKQDKHAEGKSSKRRSK